MSSPDVPTRGPARSGPYIITGILLAIAIVVPLYVPAYSVDEPRLAGMPFFYWYQMMWIPITSALVGISYWLVSKEDRRRRESVRGMTSRRGGAMSGAAVPLAAPDRPVNGVALTIVIILFVLVAVLGFVAARWRRGEETGLHSLDEWGLGGRGFGTWVTWFLLGGDLYTAYTFVAVPAQCGPPARSAASSRCRTRSCCTRSCSS